MILKIDKIINNGYGLGKISNKVFFVPYTIPGEVVDVEIAESKKSYNMAFVKDIKEISPDRIKPRCDLFKKCGGCDFLHISYEKQIEIKKNIIIEFLEKHKITVEVPVEFIKSPEPFNYRNSARFAVFNLKPAFFKKNSKDFVEVNYCFILDNKINDFISELNLKSYVDELILKIDNTEHISHNLLSSSNKKNRLKFKINDLIIEYDYRVFFQVNNSIIPVWLNLIAEFLEPFPKKRILDLYSGVGIISLFLASQYRKDIKKITGIEVDNTAVNFARLNREKNRLLNTHFVAGRVERILHNYETADIVIVDPPRSGLGKKVAENLKRIKPRVIIYSSCDISTFIRDAEKLIDAGYSLQKIVGLDMFPQTYHFETLALFSL